MEKRRVVITGMGVVVPMGIGVGNFWELSDFQSHDTMESLI